jgi:hypothetical protein
MSAAVDIYIPTQWNTSVSSVLMAAGFHVTSRDCKLPSGVSGREHSCTRNGESVTLTEVPLPDDASYIAILGLSRSKHAEALLSARDALTQHGALDSNTYSQRNRNA